METIRENKAIRMNRQRNNRSLEKNFNKKRKKRGRIAVKLEKRRKEMK